MSADSQPTPAPEPLPVEPAHVMRRSDYEQQLRPPA